MLVDGLPDGLDQAALPIHHRNGWTQDNHLIAPGGGHVITLFANNEIPMGHVTARALWSSTGMPDQFIGTIERLPLQPWAHWLNDHRFALKLSAFRRDWVRPLVVIDLEHGFVVVPMSNGVVPDMTLLDPAQEFGFAPFSETALALETDLTHLL